MTWDGVPCAYPVVADPGAISDPQLSDAVLRRCAVEARRRGLHVAELAERMGLSGPAHERPSCTVVLCTRRRPHLAARALKAIGALDPPADEVIVVDNDPGDLDCREAAAAAGARYVVERRRGLNWARAAGLAAASCDLVAFTDDDVVVSPAWLAPLGRVFGDPGVGAATGVSVGLTLDTEAQVLRESIAGLIPDLLPGRFDWTNLAPTSGGRAGAGANMVFRRDLLLRLGDVFPPDLEVGTRAGSGGDLYVLFRVLAAGRRIALEPALYAEHEHHPDFENLHSTVASYGMGFSAFLTKVAVEHKEPLALTTWWWLVERWARALVVALTTGSRTELAVRGAYLRGGVRGAAGWARARRDQRGRARRRPLGPSSQHLEPPSGLSLVVEDSPEARNRAALAAQGDVVLFLARGVRASPETAARHLARHRSLDRPAVVVGRTEPDALASGLAAQVEALGRFALLRDRRWAGSLTHAYVTGENLSIPRELFERLGGFDTTMSFDGAARELALRALKAGARIEYEHAAAADQGLSFGTAHALERAAQAGRDDARIAQLHPVAGVPSAPALAKRGIVPPAPALLVANALERGRMRRSWLGVYRRLAGTAYRTGLGASGRAAEPPFEIDLDGADPVEIPPPAVAAVSLRISDDVVGAVRPPGGRWSIGFAEAAIAALGDGPERELARARHPWRPSDATGLDGVLVLSGPHGTDDAAEAGLVAAGARVEPVSGPGEEFWDAVARRVASAPEPIVAVLLGGARADVRWLGSAVVPLRGPDVAAVVGTGVRDLAMPAPALLLSRHLAQGLYAPVGRAPQFLVLSTKKAAELGGLAACTAVFGEHGPVLDVLHRALDAGMVVAYQQTPGIAPPGTEFPASWRLELERSIARGGLLARAAIDRGPLAGIGLLAARLVIRPAATMWPALRYGWPPPRLVLGTAAGEVLGCIRALGSPGRARRAAQPGT